MEKIHSRSWDRLTSTERVKMKHEANNEKTKNGDDEGRGTVSGEKEAREGAAIDLGRNPWPSTLPC
jgi:hypothetical protein